MVRAGARLNSYGVGSATVTDPERERLYAAMDDWRAAQQACADELDKRGRGRQVAHGLPDPEKALVEEEEYREVMRLWGVAEAACEAYEAARRNVRGG